TPTRYAEASPAGGGYPDGPQGGEQAAARGGHGAAAPAAAAAPPVGPRGPGGPAQRLSMDRLASAVLPLPTTLLRIGRAADNQVVIADLSVSRYHAELRKDPRGGYTIVDLGSHNGTFVNGQRIESTPVTERDIIGIGPATYRLVGEELQEFLDTREIPFLAKGLTVTPPNRRHLPDNATLPPRQSLL